MALPRAFPWLRSMPSQPIGEAFSQTSRVPLFRGCLAFRAQVQEIGMPDGAGIKSHSGCANSRGIYGGRLIWDRVTAAGISRWVQKEVVALDVYSGFPQHFNISPSSGRAKGMCISMN